MEETKPDIFHQKLSPGTTFIVILLFLALMALSERILYDLGRLLAPGPLDYFRNLDVILVHAAFIIPLFIISIVVNVSVGEKKEKYAVVLIPYFIMTIILAMQLIFQISIYFYYHHNNFELYLVLILLNGICTYAIYEIQRRFVVN